MSLGIRIGQKRKATLNQGEVSPIYGIAKDSNGMRPSALNFQVIRNGGTSAHSFLYEGAGDLAGPWETLATVTDQLVQKYTTKVPDYVRITATTSTGGSCDGSVEGAVN